MAGKEESINFEKAIKRLEEIVKQLESEETPLDKAIKLFEEGKGLGDKCLKHLTELEKKIQLVMESEGGKVEFKDFAPPAHEGDTEEA